METMLMTLPLKPSRVAVDHVIHRPRERKAQRRSTRRSAQFTPFEHLPQVPLGNPATWQGLEAVGVAHARDLARFRHEPSDRPRWAEIGDLGAQRAAGYTSTSHGGRRRSLLTCAEEDDLINLWKFQSLQGEVITVPRMSEDVLRLHGFAPSRLWMKKLLNRHGVVYVGVTSVAERADRTAQRHARAAAKTMEPVATSGDSAAARTGAAMPAPAAPEQTFHDHSQAERYRQLGRQVLEAYQTLPGPIVAKLDLERVGDPVGGVAETSASSCGGVEAAPAALGAIQEPEELPADDFHHPRHTLGVAWRHHLTAAWALGRSEILQGGLAIPVPPRRGSWSTDPHLDRLFAVRRAQLIGFPDPDCEVAVLADDLARMSAGPEWLGFVEALAIAGHPVEQIVGLSPLSPEVIRWYLATYFDVQGGTMAASLDQHLFGGRMWELAPQTMREQLPLLAALGASPQVLRALYVIPRVGRDTSADDAALLGFLLRVRQVRTIFSLFTENSSGKNLQRIRSLWRARRAAGMSAPTISAAKLADDAALDRTNGGGAW